MVFLPGTILQLKKHKTQPANPTHILYLHSNLFSYCGFSMPLGNGFGFNKYVDATASCRIKGGNSSD